jgi:hypothetical protein
VLRFVSPRGSWGIKIKTMKNLAKKLMIVSAFAFCAALVVPLLSQAKESIDNMCYKYKDCTLPGGGTGGSCYAVDTGGDCSTHVPCK